MKYLEYIEFPQNTYFDTQIVPTINTRVEIYDLQVENPSLVAYYLFGCGIGNIYKSFYVSGNKSYYGHVGSAADANSILTGYGFIGKKLVFDKQETTLEGLFGTVSAATNTQLPVNFVDTIYINAINVNGAPYVNVFWPNVTMRLRNFKVYDDNVLVGDFYAAQDNNNVFCLFDKITQNYFYNLGSNSISGGNEYVKGEWESVTTSFDRSKKISKVAWNMDVNVPTNQNGYFSELPNIDTDGMAWRNVSGSTFGYASENRFSLDQNFFCNRYYNLTNEPWSSSTYTYSGGTYDTSDNNIWVFNCPVTYYWSGVHHNDDESINDYLGKMRVYTLNEKTISLSTDNLTYSESGGSQTVTVTSEENNWSASTQDSWITISPNSGNTGDTTVTITVKQALSSRTGTVTFTDGNSTVELTVSQIFNNNIPINKIFYNGDNI